MELKFIKPMLRDLDSAGSELLACGIFEDERPVQGTAGLVDWRMVGGLSRYLLKAKITGERGEVAMFSGKPRLPYDKVVVFGLGPRASFDEHVYRDAIEQMLTVLGDLKVRIAVVERPGRHLGVLPVDYAVDTLLELCEQMGDQDTWTLVEEVGDHKSFGDHVEQRRRRRRMR